MKVKNCVIAVILLSVSTTAAMANSEQASLQGIWNRPGYGLVYEIGSENSSIYSVTSISCSLFETVPTNLFLERIDRITQPNSERLSFFRKGEITRQNLEHLERLPRLCQAGQDGDSDPEMNFEVFWRAFNEYYAFFELRNVDWDGVYDSYRSKVSAETSQEELHSILSEIITLTGDAHVGLRAEGFPYVESGEQGTLKKLVYRGWPQDRELTIVAALKYIKTTIKNRYLQDSQQSAARGRITWGWAAEGIAYVSTDSMIGYIDRDATLTDELSFVDDLMQQILTELDGAKGFIVDARWNGGGYDAIALRIASYFAEKPIKAFTKKVRVGDSYGVEQPINIPASAGKKFVGPVVFLSGSDTLSAAEIFAMAMMALPNVTSIGEPTVGALSDMLEILLPNGWSLMLSNEIYTAIDGNCYEGLGVPVDVTLSISENDTLESYLAFGMDRAIALLLNQ